MKICVFLFLFGVLHCTLSQKLFLKSIIPKPGIVGAIHWSSQKKSAFFADGIRSIATIYRFDYPSDDIFSATIPGEKYAVALNPVDGTCDRFVATLEDSIKLVEWDGLSSTVTVLNTIFQAPPNPLLRMERVQVDPTGRLYFGQYNLGGCGGDPDATLWSYREDEGVQVVLTGVVTNSGLAWYEKKQKFYFLEGCKYRMYEYDWDPATGQICNPKVVFNFPTIPGQPTYFPFGLDIDRNGYLYASKTGTGEIVKIDPRTNKIVKTVKTPAKLIEEPRFASPDLTELHAVSQSRVLNIFTGQLVSPHPSFSNGGKFIKIIDIGAIGFDDVNVKA